MPMPNDFVEDVLRIKNIEKQLDERAKRAEAAEAQIEELRAALADMTNGYAEFMVRADKAEARVKELLDQNSVLKAQVVALQGRLENQRRRKPNNDQTSNNRLP